MGLETNKKDFWERGKEVKMLPFHLCSSLVSAMGCYSFETSYFEFFMIGRVMIFLILVFFLIGAYFHYVCSSCKSFYSSGVLNIRKLTTCLYFMFQRSFFFFTTKIFFPFYEYLSFFFPSVGIFCSFFLGFSFFEQATRNPTFQRSFWSRVVCLFGEQWQWKVFWKPLSGVEVEEEEEEKEEEGGEEFLLKMLELFQSGKKRFFDFKQRAREAIERLLRELKELSEEERREGREERFFADEEVREVLVEVLTLLRNGGGREEEREKLQKKLPVLKRRIRQVLSAKGKRVRAEFKTGKVTLQWRGVDVFLEIFLLGTFSIPAYIISILCVVLLRRAPQRRLVLFLCRLYIFHRTLSSLSVWAESFLFVGKKLGAISAERKDFDFEWNSFFEGVWGEVEEKISEGGASLEELFGEYFNFSGELGFFSLDLSFLTGWISTLNFGTGIEGIWNLFRAGEGGSLGLEAELAGFPGHILRWAAMSPVASLGEVEREMLPVISILINERFIFLLSSSDVIHSFGCPGLGIKEDLVPGVLVSFEVYTGGPYGESFEFFCYEHCGTQHAYMRGVLVVVRREDGFIRNRRKF